MYHLVVHKITLLTVGALKEPWAKEACKMYRERLSRSVDFQVLELGQSRQSTAGAQMAEESDRLLTSARKMHGRIWVLDERGERLTSTEFAESIGTMRDRGEPIVFILGGAYGLTDNVRSAADRIVSVSSMVFPHELCRVVLLEQLYRAEEILKGSGYHH